MARIQADLSELANDETVFVEGGEDAELDILNELHASPDDVTWKFSVTRVTGASKDGAKEPFLFEGDSAVMEGLHTRLRDEFGTGIYRVRVLKNRRLYRRFDIAVEAPQKKPEPQRSDMSSVLAAINAANEKTLQVLERLAERQQIPQYPPTPPIDPIDTMTKMATAMSSMMAIFRPAEASSSTDLILKGVELRDKLLAGSDGGGNDDGDISLMGLLKSALQLPAVQQAITQQLQQPSPMAQPRPPVQPQQPPNNRQTPQVIGADEATQTMIKNALQYLNAKAVKGSDPGFYADWVHDNWPRELITIFLQQSDPSALIIGFMPETAPNIGWFKRLIDELRKLVNDAASKPLQAAHASGNPSPNGSNGDTGGSGGSESDIADDGGTDEEW